jgi:hypothetical protein
MENNKSIFFDNSNFYLLYNILKKDLKNKFSYNLDNESQGKIKLFEIMNQIYNNNINKDLKNLNFLSLRTSAPILKSMCEKNLQDKIEKNSSLNRDMLLQKKVPEFIDMRPEFLEKTSKNVDDAYQNVNDRYKTSKPKPIDFSLPVNNNDKINLDDYQKQRQSDIGGETNISDIIDNNMSSSINNLKESDNHTEIDKNPSINQMNNSMLNFEESQNLFKNQADEEMRKIEKSKNEINNSFKDNMKIQISEHKKENNFDGNFSQIDQRNADTYKIISEGNNDEVNFYRNNKSISEEVQEEYIKYQHRDGKQESNVISQDDKKITKKINILEINSANRNWENLPDITKLNKQSGRYDFPVFFNAATNEYINIPIYENNIFTFLNIFPDGNVIPYSESNIEIYREIISGTCSDIQVGDPLQIYQNEIYNKEFKDQDIVRNPFYDPNKDKGQIIYYVKKLISGNNSANIMNIYKNISKISLNEIIVPYDYLFTTYSEKTTTKGGQFPLINPPTNDFCKNDNLYNYIFQQSIFSYPYMLLYIDEIDGIYDASSNTVEKSFCKVTIAGDWSVNLYEPNSTIACPGRLPGFVKLVPLGNNGKEYPQSALATLNKMTIRLLNPQGSIINSNMDVSIIDQACYLPLGGGKFDKRCIIIRTKNWVAANMFLINQIIRINRFNISLKSNNQNTNIGIEHFSKFLNRENGHTIVNIGYIENDKDIGISPITLDSNKSGYINVIFIYSPGYLKEETGEWVPSLNLQNKEGEELITEDLMLYLSSPELRGMNYGKMINISMQTSLSFTVETLEADSHIIKSQII